LQEDFVLFIIRNPDVVCPVLCPFDFCIPWFGEAAVDVIHYRTTHTPVTNGRHALH